MVKRTVALVASAAVLAAAVTMVIWQSNSAQAAGLSPSPRADHTFDPATGNTVTVPVSGTARYLWLTFTGNTGWPAGQLSEFEVHGP